MAIVQGLDVVLKIFSGLGGYQSVACNASCSLVTSRDYLETTFLDSGQNRNFIPNKLSHVLRGNGPIVYGRPFTQIDIYNMHLAGTTIAWSFELTDSITTAVYQGTGFFTEINLDGTIGQAGTCDYTIQVTGAISVSGTATGSEDNEVFVFHHEETLGGTTTIGDADLVGVTVLEVLRNGIGLEIITVGTPGMSQAKYDSGAGTVEFGMALEIGELIDILYST